MKLSGNKAAAFLKKPPPGTLGILLFGPDAGLVRERGTELCALLAGEDGGPAIHEYTGDAIRKDPALLSDAASALSLMGGDPVVRVRDAGDALVSIIEPWFTAGGGINPGIFEAGELAPRSKLRQLFEKHDKAAAIGCYPDEGASLETVVRQHMRDNGITLADGGAVSAVLSHLGTDRMAIRQELDKLVLYAGGPGSGGSLNAADVEAAIGDVKAASMDDLAFATAGGDPRRLAHSLDRAAAEGLAPVALIRTVQRHFDRLLTVKAAEAAGEDPGTAMKRLRPPVFFKTESVFRGQVARWSMADLTRCQRLLVETERDCKSGLAIDQSVFERALLQICQVARRKSR